jgi:hypothetical protein
VSDKLLQYLLTPASPTPPSAMKTSEKTDEERDDPEPTDEGDIQMEYSD